MLAPFSFAIGARERESIAAVGGRADRPDPPPILPRRWKLAGSRKHGLPVVTFPVRPPTLSSLPRRTLLQLPNQPDQESINPSLRRQILVAAALSSLPHFRSILLPRSPLNASGDQPLVAGVHGRRRRRRHRWGQIPTMGSGPDSSARADHGRCQGGPARARSWPLIAGAVALP